MTPNVYSFNFLNRYLVKTLPILVQTNLSYCHFGAILRVNILLVTYWLQIKDWLLVLILNLLCHFSDIGN